MRVAGLWLSLVAAWASYAPAQEGPRLPVPAIEGRVTDTLGAPLARAYVRRVGAPAATVCDDSGYFRLTDVVPGKNAIEVRRLGYIPGRFSVDVPADSVVHVVVQLAETATRLKPVTVREQGLSPSLVEHGFYERMRMRVGSGTFITPEEFEALHPEHVTEVLFARPGVQMGYNGRERLAVPWDRSGRCILSVFVDGVRITGLYDFEGQHIGGLGGGPRRITGIGIDGFVKPNAVKAIEIYPSAAQTPQEFQTFGDCGAIVIWTKVD